jgi:glutathione S-transferase
LYESRAICHYIATKYAGQGTPLIPWKLHENALFHQAASVELNFNEHVEKAVFENLVKV